MRGDRIRRPVGTEGGDVILIPLCLTNQERGNVILKALELRFHLPSQRRLDAYDYSVPRQTTPALPEPRPDYVAVPGSAPVG